MSDDDLGLPQMPPTGAGGGLAITQAEMEGLRRIRERALSENTRAAVESDLAYLEAWCLSCTGESMTWPAPPALLARFVAHHFDEMPEEIVKGIQRYAPGRLQAGSLSTPSVLRVISSWRTEHDRMGIQNTLRDPAFVRLVREGARQDERIPGRKSRKPVTAEELSRLLVSRPVGDDPGADLRDIRDKAILYFGFSSGGRRRSEIASLTLDRLERETVPDGNSGKRVAYRIFLGKTKTTRVKDRAWVELSGRGAEALDAWIEAAGLSGQRTGAVFRAVDKWGNISPRKITPKAVNDILKKRVAAAGLPVEDYSAHGLRSGFLTECSRRGIGIEEAMSMSLHKDVKTAARYFAEGKVGRRRAARLMDDAPAPVAPGPSDQD